MFTEIVYKDFIATLSAIVLAVGSFVPFFIRILATRNINDTLLLSVLFLVILLLLYYFGMHNVLAAYLSILISFLTIAYVAIDNIVFTVKYVYQKKGENK